MEEKQLQRLPSSSSYSSSSLPSLSSEEELQHMPLEPPMMKAKKRLSKQLSMCETSRDLAWERRRRQTLRQRNGINDHDDITDEDMHELKGCIELGFRFDEVEGQRLCGTLPALDLYFAVNRQLSPVSSPHSRRSTSSIGGSSSVSNESPQKKTESPKSDSESWKICSPGDNPEQVKTKLRHWAQAVACSVMQSY